MMKALFLFLFLFMAGTLISSADDNLLGNGEFSDGLAHWFGDIRPASDLVAGDLTQTTGGAIKLRSRDWTKVTQSFDLAPGVYKLHITFTFSPDIKLSQDIPDFVNMKEKLNFQNEHSIDGHPGQWLLVIADPKAANSLVWTVTPTTLLTDPQSYTFTIKNIEFQNKQTLMIAFPPGNGYVILQKAVLVPAPASNP